MLGAKPDPYKYDVIIGNPPYKKIPKDAVEAHAMPDICYGAPNLYFCSLRWHYSISRMIQKWYLSFPVPGRQAHTLMLSDKSCLVRVLSNIFICLSAEIRFLKTKVFYRRL